MVDTNGANHIGPVVFKPHALLSTSVPSAYRAKAVVSSFEVGSIQYGKQCPYGPR
jgi:hypothetical protein